LTTQLHPNYPNPFNPETTIKYQLSEPGEVRLEVYDLMGRKVKTLVNTQKRTGYYETIWTGRNESGQRVASGIYIYRMDVITKTDHLHKTMKMVLLK
jgi:flagellar hook assembly protein FlgD